jgi:hypothetical protein
LEENLISPVAARAIVEAIAANEETALVELKGFKLAQYLDVLDMSQEIECTDNKGILERLRERHPTQSTKSARGGAR